MDEIEQLLRKLDGQELVCNALLKEVQDLGKDLDYLGNKIEDLEKFAKAREILIEIIK